MCSTTIYPGGCMWHPMGKLPCKIRPLQSQWRCLEKQQSCFSFHRWWMLLCGAKKHFVQNQQFCTTTIHFLDVRMSQRTKMNSIQTAKINAKAFYLLKTKLHFKISSRRSLLKKNMTSYWTGSMSFSVSWYIYPVASRNASAWQNSSRNASVRQNRDCLILLPTSIDQKVQSQRIVWKRTAVQRIVSRAVVQRIASRAVVQRIASRTVVQKIAPRTVVQRTVVQYFSWWFKVSRP